jgi:hypothetical protein
VGRASFDSGKTTCDACSAGRYGNVTGLFFSSFLPAVGSDSLFFSVQDCAIVSLASPVPIKALQIHKIALNVLLDDTRIDTTVCFFLAPFC